MSDLHTILQKSIAGKRKFQEQLYDRFSNMVYGVCLRYARESTIAEDYFQDIFIKVFQQLSKVEKAEALPGWIRMVAVNYCIDKVRSERSFEMEIDEVGESSDESYHELIDKISEEEIVQLINQLPKGYRLVFNMSIDGFSHKEISEELGIGESTSRSQLTYARRFLQEKLKRIGIIKYESVI